VIARHRRRRSTGSPAERSRFFHASNLSGQESLFLLVWPPLVLGAEELRKAVITQSV
jgi:hypothetical protein